MVTNQKPNKTVPASSTPSQWLTEGDQLYQARRYKDALQCYQKAVESEPQNAVAWHNKAQAQVMCLKYKESIETCLKAIELNPRNAATWFLKSFAHGVLGEYQDALDASTKGLELDPTNKMVWSTRGQYLYALGRLEEALESFSTALKMNPDNAYFQEVNDKIKKWLQRDGKSVEWANQVMDFLRQGGNQEALATYRDSLKVDPRSVSRAFDKNYALAHLENPEKLMQNLESTKAKDQPQLLVELTQKEFEFSREAWIEVHFTNKGKTPARDLSFHFSSEVAVKQLDVSPELVQQMKTTQKAVDMDMIPELPAGNKIKRLISLTPTKLGQIALEVQLGYTDLWGAKQTKTAVTWISVFKPGGQMPTIPGYKMLWRLSNTESTSIYVAQHVGDSTRVVAKLLQFIPEQTSLITEFMNEMKQLSKLSHPNIVRIFQYGEKPTPWLTMEYMSKGTLTRRIGKLSLPEALNIGIKLADALIISRNIRLPHRWINPDNILFDDKDTPKFTNWRVGYLTQRLKKNTSLAETITPYYPPEKITPGLGPMDWVSDVYMFGAVLYEMLTGKPPFQEKGQPLVDAIKSGHPHKPSIINSALNSELDTILMTCLARNKKDRYQNPAQLKTDLEKAAKNLSANG